MASFHQHIHQSKNNLFFLEQINKHSTSYWDWQVTVSFYVAVHLINAHIYEKTKLTFRSHEQVADAINPYSIMSLAKFPEKEYLAYRKLQGLSRRSRYLCHDDLANKDTQAHFTYDKHLAKAVKSLDILIDFFRKEYEVNFNKTILNCLELQKTGLNNFIISYMQF